MDADDSYRARYFFESTQHRGVGDGPHVGAPPELFRRFQAIGKDVSGAQGAWIDHPITPLEARLMSHVPARSALVGAPPRASSILGWHTLSAWHWLRTRITQARNRQALTPLDERLLADIGMTRAGQTAPRAGGCV